MSDISTQLLKKSIEASEETQKIKLTEQRLQQLKTIMEAIATDDNTPPKMKSHLMTEKTLEDIKQEIIDTYELVETILPGGCVRDGMDLPTTSDQIAASQELLWAASKNDLNHMHTLLSQPNINLNVQGSFGETPLHIAVILEHHDVAKLLIEHGADISIMAYGETDDEIDGYSPLEMALAANQDEIVQLMLHEGNMDNYDSEELFFVTAAYELLTPFMDLIEAKAYQDISKTYLQHLTLLKLLDVSELLAHEADDVDIAQLQDAAAILCELAKLTGTAFGSHLWPDGQIEPLGAWIETYGDIIEDPTIHSIAMDTASQLNQIDGNRQHFLNAKLLFHIIPVEGEFTIKYDSLSAKPTTGFFEAEGLFHCYTVPVIEQGLQSYLDNPMFTLTSQQQHAVEAAHDAFALSAQHAYAYGLQSTAQSFYENYQSNQTIVLPSGWPGHAMDVVIDKTTHLLAMSNNGWRYQGLESGSTLFKIHNPDAITPDLIHTILMSEDQADIELNLAVQLGLEKITELPEMNQIVGNCAWVSHESAVESLIYIDLIKQGLEDSQATTIAHDSYHDWSQFMGYSFVKWYFDGDVRIDDKGVEALIKAQASLLHTEDMTLFRQDPIGKILSKAYEDLSGHSVDLIDLSPQPDLLNLEDLFKDLKFLDLKQGNEALDQHLSMDNTNQAISEDHQAMDLSFIQTPSTPLENVHDSMEPF